MRRGRILILLALILIIGLFAVAVVYLNFLQPTQEAPTVVATPTPIDMVNVIVITQRVERGNVLDETVVGMIPIPRDVVIQGYFTDVAEVVGRRARVDLEPNMIVTSGMVVDTSEAISESGSDAAIFIPRGMVAVSIPINKLSSVSYAPQAGDHVNVIASMMFVDLDTEYQAILPNDTASVIAAGTQGEGGITTLTANVQGGGEGATSQGRSELDPLLEQSFYIIPSERQRPRLVSQNLLQNAVVLGVGSFPLRDKEPEVTPTEEVSQQLEGEVAEEGQATPPPPPTPPEVITLVVTPQDAVTLNYLMFSGAKLTLALRQAGDDTRVETEAATLDFLLTQYNIPVPVKLPYGMEPRIDEPILPEVPNVIEPTPVP
jgi:pilus assembly protein CpaB